MSAELMAIIDDLRAKLSAAETERTNALKRAELAEHWIARAEDIAREAVRGKLDLYNALTSIIVTGADACEDGVCISCRIERERDEARRDFLACAVAAGIYYAAEGVDIAPGPVEEVVEAIRETARERDTLREQLAAISVERDEYRRTILWNVDTVREAQLLECCRAADERAEVAEAGLAAAMAVTLDNPGDAGKPDEP